jgi:hypothetical protein
LTPPSRHREPHHAANLSRRRDDQQPPPGLPETGPPGPDERNHSPHSATGGTTPNPTTNGCLRRPHRHRARRPASRPSGRSAVGLRPSLDPARRARHATSDRKQPKHEPANPLTGPAPSGMTCGNVGYLPPSVPPLEQAAVTKQSHKPAAPLCSSGSCLQRRTAAESFFIPQAMRWVGAGQASAESDVVGSAVVSQVTVPILSTATRSPAVGLRPSLASIFREPGWWPWP